MIWKRIDPTDRAAFALTSKSHAAMYQELKGKKVERAGKMIRRLPGPIRISRTARLKVLVRLRDWIPQKYRLCYKCVIYLDIKSTGRMGAQWGGDKKFVEGGKATQAAIDRGPRCPLCVRRGLVEMAKHKQEWKKYQRLGRQVVVKQLDAII